MRRTFLHPCPSSKGLVCDIPLTNGFLSGGFAEGATVQEKTNTYTCTATGTAADIPIPVYPGFDFTAATSHYLDIGAGPASVKTISLWVKQDDIAGNEYPIDLNGTDYIAVESGVVTVYGLVGHSLYVDGVLGESGVTEITTGWHHIALTDATANNASDFDIGRVTAAYFDGIISEVRLYDRVLGALEILDIYNLQKWRYGR